MSGLKLQVGRWRGIKSQLIDRKGYLEDLRKEKETEIKKKMRCKKRGSKQEWKQS